MNATVLNTYNIKNDKEQIKNICIEFTLILEVITMSIDRADLEQRMNFLFEKAKVKYFTYCIDSQSISVYEIYEGESIGEKTIIAQF